MELELQITAVERSGDFASGGSAELVAAGGGAPAPWTDVDILITILLLLFLGVVFSLSSSGQAFFNFLDTLGQGRVTDGGGGGAEFTFENR